MSNSFRSRRLKWERFQLIDLGCYGAFTSKCTNFQILFDTWIVRIRSESVRNSTKRFYLSISLSVWPLQSLLAAIKRRRHVDKHCDSSHIELYLDCTQSLLVSDRLERARCTTARDWRERGTRPRGEWGRAERNKENNLFFIFHSPRGCASRSLQSLSYCGREKKGTACSLNIENKILTRNGGEGWGSAGRSWRSSFSPHTFAICLNLTLHSSRCTLFAVPWGCQGGFNWIFGSQASRTWEEDRSPKTSQA